MTSKRGKNISRWVDGWMDGSPKMLDGVIVKNQIETD